MGKIKAIDKSSIHRICSGQVIVDLSIAVKELLENSLDAGSTTVGKNHLLLNIEQNWNYKKIWIEIRFKESGLEFIELIDNGSGIDESDYPTLGEIHLSTLRQEYNK